MKLTLYPEQEAQIARWMAEPTKSILDGSPMGVGLRGLVNPDIM